MVEGKVGEADCKIYCLRSRIGLGMLWITVN